MPFRRRFAHAYAQLRRDASMVVGPWLGRRPVPFTTRASAPRPHATSDETASRHAALLAPRTVRIAEVIRETADAVTVVFEDPNGQPISFVPGQFFTLLLPVGGEILRRAYSASSDVRDPSRVGVTVKRVAGGVVSNHVNDRLRAGDTLQVLGPSGNFVVPAGEGSDRHLVLLAGGSGITPMMAIARHLLEAEPRTRLTLVYGNRGEADVIFRAALEALVVRHGDRFHVRHVLSAPPAGWTGGSGLLEEAVVASELEACRAHDAALFLICGPEPMMAASRAALRARGVPDAKILEERFNMPHLRARPATVVETTQLLTIRAGSAGRREVYVAPGETMLEAGLSAGVSMDYSCAMGGCAACKVRLCDGEVEMEEPNCLTVEERAQGYVLACVGRVRTPVTIALAGDPSFAPKAEAAE
ncbi:MAG TPA: ferredoxin--NADP reductase [Polyangiaceae bacterium]